MHLEAKIFMEQQTLDHAAALKLEAKFLQSLVLEERNWSIFLSLVQ